MYKLSLEEAYFRAIHFGLYQTRVSKLRLIAFDYVRYMIDMIVPLLSSDQFLNDSHES